MENKELFRIAETTFKSCLDTMAKKNHDYAKDTVDALRNFKAVEYFKLTDAPTGVAVRLCDKWMRICNLLNTEAQVKDEKVEDTINDMINYLVILKASIIERDMLKVSGEIRQEEGG
jgi:hypothetical protein